MSLNDDLFCRSEPIPKMSPMQRSVIIIILFKALTSATFHFSGTTSVDKEQKKRLVTAGWVGLSKRLTYELFIIKPLLNFLKLRLF